MTNGGARRTPTEVLATVLDPELPVLSIADLGIVRDVREVDGTVEVTITPTYSGCPAMDAIATDIAEALGAAGYPDVAVRTVLAPAWSTDWITATGRRRLAEAGIAPPQPARTAGTVSLELAIRCPQCGSTDTALVSHFGSTACKALRVCSACREPFDHLKPL